MKKTYLFTCLLLLVTGIQAQQKYDPKETEYYTPVPRLVNPGNLVGQPPSDAIILLGGNDLSEW